MNHSSLKPGTYSTCQRPEKLPNIHGTVSVNVTVPAPKSYVVCDLDRHLDSMDHGYGCKFDIRQIREMGGVAGKRVRLLSARGRGGGLGNDIVLVGWRILTRPTGRLGLEKVGGWR